MIDLEILPYHTLVRCWW